MKIAIIGHGRMGRAVESIARGRGHEIVAVIDADNHADIHSDAFRSADVAIEFSIPSQAADNIIAAAAEGVRVVCGTTGWYDRKAEVDAAVNAASTALLAATNFSIGVYVFNRLNRCLSRMMGNLADYHPEVTETHHIHKLDYPSGTAITIAESMVEENPRLKSWTCNGCIRHDKDVTDVMEQIAEAGQRLDETPDDIVPILAIREGEVPGTHTVIWQSEIDSIEITHEANSREGFALGAVVAAEWIADRKGVFTIDDCMNSILSPR
ncbi:MAG: 4-hydroxy-tetrahydrodipicolinate reductase [Duncaniella sp.]|nr:4-hydroxy-tetrahydrodipicolinate reductase [Duncaniella sp.]